MGLTSVIVKAYYCIVNVLIRMKRTEQIDNDREVALPQYGRDVFTTVGELKLTPEQEEEKRDNTLKALRKAEVLQETLKAMARVEARLELEFRKMVPLQFSIGRWCMDNGIHIYREGLEIVVKKIGGPVIFELPIPIPYGMSEEAEEFLDEQLEKV